MKRVARTRSEVRLTVTIAYTKVVVFDSEWKMNISFAEYGSTAGAASRKGGRPFAPPWTSQGGA